MDKIAQECAGEQSQVFGYTCEAPQGGTDLAEVPENNYFCIHNMINAVDIVPFVAPSLMGFKRYGVDHYVPGTNAGEVKTTQKKIARGGEGGPSTVTTHADNEPVKAKTDAYDIQKSEMLYQLKALNSSTSYNDSFRPYALDFLSFEFPFDFETMKIYEEGSKDNNRAEDFVADFVRFLQEGLEPGDLYGKGKPLPAGTSMPGIPTSWTGSSIQPPRRL